MYIENSQDFIRCVSEKVKSRTKNFKEFPIPQATYAEFNCTYQTSKKTNQFIYRGWLPSTLWNVYFLAKNPYSKLISSPICKNSFL